ncbi:MAG TPA: amino acid adenylation domain-containing protein, partial [Pyrinomonadaceae bacterium]
MIPQTVDYAPERGDGEDSYVSSPLQEGMLFHSLYAPKAQMYIRQIIFSLREDVAAHLLEQAWERAFRRHSILRASLRWQGGGEPLVEIHSWLKLPFERQDWREVSAGERDARLESFTREERRRGFDLSSAPLMRLKLLRLSDADYRLVWTFHHVLSDTYSDILLIKEVFATYDSLRRGKDLLLEAPPSYREHCEWLRSQDTARAEDYWREKLRGFAEPTPLEMGSGPAVAEDSGEEREERTLRLPAELTARLKSLARTHDLTLNTILQGAWALLLSRYSGKGDVVFGAVRRCRRSASGGKGAPSVVGLFVNTLPMRVQVSPDMALLPWLKSLRQQWIDLRDYEQIAQSQILDWSGVPHGTPLFESTIVYDNSQMNSTLRAHFGPAWVNREVRTLQARSNYPLTLSAYGEEEFLISVRYDRNRFEGASIELMLERLRLLFESVAADIEQKLSDIKLMTSEEEQKLLYGFNDTLSEYPRRATIHQLFAEQAALSPDATALVCGPERLTYRQLDERAGRLASRLRALGVGPESLVALCLERSAEAVVALLGVLKAGGAYLPLDPADPPARLLLLVAEAEAGVVLTRRRHAPLLGGTAARLLLLDDDDGEADEGVPAADEASATNLAYVLFTSGSTGRPKAVGVEHRAVVRLVRGADYAEFAPSEVFLQLAPLAFDASTFEIWGALLNGARLVVMPPGAASLDDIAAAVGQHGVTTLWLTAGLFHLMAERRPEDLRGLRQLLAGGDVLSPSRVREFVTRCPDTRLINGYGPTEGTTFTCCHEVRDAAEVGATVPIGRPIANTRVYLLDGRMRPVPAGMRGELYIGGDGVARGYLNRPGLTAERFVPDPFSPEPGARLYRSGDGGRYHPDGVVEFLGRRDGQVKVRGFRVELGEVEAALGGLEEVAAAAVVAREGAGGERRLVGYVALREGCAASRRELRERLRGRVPDYMVPAVITVLERLPLNENGKVDRRALPEPREDAAEEYEEPRGEMEKVLAGMWEQVLGVARVSRTANFFDLGGNSLRAMQLMSRVRETLGVSVALRTVFECPTVAELAERVAPSAVKGAGPDAPPIVRVSREVPLPLSFEQRRLWFFDQLVPGSPLYNVPVAYRVRGPLDAAALEEALDRIVARHEVLRTAFAEVDGEPAQVIRPHAAVPLEVVRVRAGDAGADEELGRLVREEGRRPFDLTRGPLLRAKLFRRDEREHVLVVTIHHIAADGPSINIFMRELAALYEASVGRGEARLPELPVQYADYAAWQRGWLRGEEVERQLAYWKRRLEGAPAACKLPTDRPRPPSPSYRGAFRRFEVGEDVFAALKALGRAENASLFMTLLAAYATLLSRYSGETDILIGAPMAHRSRAEVEHLIGFFTNTLVLRVDLSGDPTFRELVGRVRGVSLEAYAHQDLPFEKLVEELHPQRDMSRSPVFQVAFSLQDAAAPAPAAAGVTLEPSNVDIQIAKFDLCLYAFPSERALSGFLACNLDLFSLETASRMVRHFVRLLGSAAAQPDARLSAREMLLD